MKRIGSFLLTTILILLAGGVICLLLFHTESKVEKFNVSDYSRYIDQFPSDKVLGPINSAKIAKEKAEVIWIELYGEEVKQKKPYSVFFDEIHGIWMIQGSLTENWIGGVPYIIIQKSDGKILAVWHEK